MRGARIRVSRGIRPERDIGGRAFGRTRNGSGSLSRPPCISGRAGLVWRDLLVSALCATAWELPGRHSGRCPGMSWLPRCSARARCRGRGCRTGRECGDTRRARGRGLGRAGPRGGSGPRGGACARRRVHGAGEADLWGPRRGAASAVTAGTRSRDCEVVIKFDDFLVQSVAVDSRPLWAGRVTAHDATRARPITRCSRCWPMRGRRALPEGGGAVMGTALWIGLGVAAWLVLALVVALLVGRMVRQRDQQVTRSRPCGTRPRGLGAPRQAVDHPGRYLHGRS